MMRLPFHEEPNPIIKSLLSSDQLTQELALSLKDAGFRNPQSAWSALKRIVYAPQMGQLFPGLLSSIFDSLSSSFDPERGLYNFERFASSIYDRNYFYTILAAQPEVMDMLAAIFSGSQYLSDMLVADLALFDWLILKRELWRRKFKDELYSNLSDYIYDESSFEGKLKGLRKFKKREYLRIGLRDLLREADLSETMDELSSLADACLQKVYEICNEELSSKYGIPCVADENGHISRCEFAIIAMGKLGGQELNFSSDVDLQYIYSSDKGSTTGIPGPGGAALNIISNHEYFTQLGQMATRALSEITEDGHIFRVDLGLRPEGKSGDIANSVRSCEIYYESWGQTWERQSLIKARCAAGSEELAEEFLNLIRPFVYRKYLDFSAFDEIREMKAKIDSSSLSSGAKEVDLKRGPGGIREIEFIIQAFQLIYGGREEWLQERNSLRALHRIVDKGHLTYDEYSSLANAYTFLRELEHRVQIAFGIQSHKLPTDARERAALARKMGLTGKDEAKLAGELTSLYQSHTANVSAIYRELFGQPAGGVRSRKAPKEEFSLEDEDCALVLAELGFEDPKRALKNLLAMRDGPPFSHPSAKSKHYFATLLPSLLKCAAEAPDPDMALTNFEKFLTAHGAKESLYSLLLKGKAAMGALLSLFGSSPYLSKILTQRAELIDAILSEDALARSASRAELEKEAQESIAHGSSREAKLDALRKFKQETELRAGLRAIAKRWKGRHYPSLTKLAEVLLSKVIDLEEGALRAEYGQPMVQLEGGGVCPCQLAVVGLGKLGGNDMGFGSDLDLFFVYTADGQTEGGREALSNSFYYAKLAERIIHSLTSFSRYGYAYRLDLRLRPNGRGGELIVSLNGLKKYLQTRASPWERLAFTKARVVAGGLELSSEVAATLVDFVYGGPFDHGFAQAALEMRQRLEEEHPGGEGGRINVKFGKGGLLDIEFLVQLMQIKYGAKDKNLRSTETKEVLLELKRHGHLVLDDYKKLQRAYHFLRRAEENLRIADERPLSELPGDGKKLLALAKVMGYRGDGAAEKFLSDFSNIASNVREIYNRLMSPLI